MKAFAALFNELDASTSTAHKVDAMQRYFSSAPPADAAWAAYFLAGGKPRQTVPTAVMGQTACEAAGIDDWLFEACYQAVGDLAETIAHVLPLRDDDATRTTMPAWPNGSSSGCCRCAASRPRRRPRRCAAGGCELDTSEAFLLIKLIGGGFRVGVSKLLVQRALAQAAGLDAKLVAQRMMGYTDARTPPTAARYARCWQRPTRSAASDGGQPYPFFLAHQLDVAPDGFDERARAGQPTGSSNGNTTASAPRRSSAAGRVWLWSRGEELVSETFPDALRATGRVARRHRARRRVAGVARGSAAARAVCAAAEALEPQGDRGQAARRRAGALRRLRPARRRRRRRARAAAGRAPRAAEARLRRTAIALSPLVQAADWPAYAGCATQSRERGVEGFMLKHRTSGYGSGRTKAEGTWWKWKIDPMTADGVLVYAQAGHGRRASVYTDYTFAVWNRTPPTRRRRRAWSTRSRAARRSTTMRDEARRSSLALVPFAKAYSGLTDEEFKRIDRVIRATTIEKFGPVRTVRPTLVFELGFEGIQRSNRHKSGIAVRFPRMLRIRDDKPLHEADTLETLRALIGARNCNQHPFTGFLQSLQASRLPSCTSIAPGRALGCASLGLSGRGPRRLCMNKYHSRRQGRVSQP